MSMAIRISFLVAYASPSNRLMCICHCPTFTTSGQCLMLNTERRMPEVSCCKWSTLIHSKFAPLLTEITKVWIPSPAANAWGRESASSRPPIASATHNLQRHLCEALQTGGLQAGVRHSGATVALLRWLITGEAGILYLCMALFAQGSELSVALE